MCHVIHYLVLSVTSQSYRIYLLKHLVSAFKVSKMQTPF